VTEKVFAEIAETPKKKADYTTFLNIDKIMLIDESPELIELKEMYDELVNENKGAISTMAALEEIIIQIRCKEVITSELRLSLSRNYIYARSTFYRRGNKINDIRVLIGTVEKYGDKVDELINDEPFRLLCYTYLVGAMNKEIELNKITLKTLMKV
jgi:hypothetical protein